MHTWRAELHVHTLLSPCAEVEMIPPLIVQSALELGIQIIAITDHNASANAAAVMRAATGSTLAVLPGMELQTQEDVHLLCLFDQLEALFAWQTHIDALLPTTENNIEFFGEQFVVDETGDFLRRENRLLITSAAISLEAAIRGVRDMGGLAIPAHVDRKANGLIANLGFIPPEAGVEAVEISRHLPAGAAVQRFPQLRGYPLLQGGDAHRLDELRGANRLAIEAPTIAEIRLAVHGQAGRSLWIQP